MIKRCFIRKYIAIFALCVSAYCSCFAQGAVVTYATGKRFNFNQNNLDAFPSNDQLENLTHVIAMGIGVQTNTTTGAYIGLWVRSEPTPPNEAGLPFFWYGYQQAGVWSRTGNNGSYTRNRWLLELVSRAHERGVKVSICISGGDEEREHWLIATENKTNRDKFVADIVKFVEVHNLDGVDINWEYPGRISRNNFVTPVSAQINEWGQCIALLNDLKAALPCSRISITLSAADPTSTQWYPYDPAVHNEPIQQRLWNAADAIQLMTYDEGGWPSHSAAGSAINRINDWARWGTSNMPNNNPLNLDFDKRKLFLGSAFYGWHPNLSGGKVSHKDIILDGALCNNLGDTPGDTGSAANKVSHCHDNGYGGVFIYELSYDLPVTHSQSLLKAAWDKNNDKGGHSTATIITQPTPYTSFIYGSGNTSVELTVEAGSNFPVLSYQWYSNTTNSKNNGTAIHGATSPSYTTPGALPHNTYYYCLINTSVGDICSNVAQVILSYVTSTDHPKPPPSSPSISGNTSNVCYNGSNFELLNAAGPVVWEVSGPFIATVNPSNLSLVTVKKTGSSNSNGTLVARIGGNVVDSKTITACPTPKISGVNGMLTGATNSFTISNTPPVSFTWGSSSNINFNSASGNSASFTAISAGQGWVSITFEGQELDRRNINVLAPFIQGPEVICRTTYFTSSGHNATWSVSAGFNVHNVSGNWTEVTADPPYTQTGTLTAVVNGAMQRIPIRASATIPDCWPETVNYYWNDLNCDEYVLLNPPLPTQHPNATYRWEIIYSDGASFNFSSGTYSPTAELWFNGNGGTATVYAYLSVPPYGDSPFAAYEYRMSTVDNCVLQIHGPSAICFSGNYAIHTSHPISWSVTPSGSSGFYISSMGSRAYVYTYNHNISGTITAVANGVTYTMPVYSYAQGNCPWPDTEFVYMTDLACGASVTLTPYPYGTYMWDVISSGNVNLHFQSGTNSNSVGFTFTGDDHGWLRMDAYFDGSPHPTIEYRISADCGRSSPENLIIAYPNPVSGILTIELDAAFVEMTRIFQPTARRNQEPTFDVRLYDRLGNMLRHATTKGEAVHFNVYGLPVGMYYVHIYDGTNEKPKIKQIVVER